MQTLFINVLILFLNVGTGILTARLLGPEGRGVQAAIILWPQLLGSTLTLGLPSALLYHLKKNSGEADKLLSASLFAGLSVGLVGAAVGWVFTPTWLSGYSVGVVTFTRLGMILVPVMLVSTSYLAVFQAREDFGFYNTLRIFQPLVSLFILVVLALTQSLTAISAAFAFMIPCVPTLAWLLIRVRRSNSLSVRNLGGAYRQLFSYGLRSYGTDLLSALSTQLDRVVIVALLTPESLGVYAVALSLARALTVFQSAVASVLFPKAVGKSVLEIVEMSGRAARISTAVTVAAAGTLAVVGPWLITFLYGQEFSDSVLLFRILLIDSVLMGLGWILAQGFNALGKPELIAVRQGISLAVTVPLMLILGKLGIVGIAAAITVGSVVRLAMTLSAYPLLLKTPAPKLLPQLSDLSYLKSVFK